LILMLTWAWAGVAIKASRLSAPNDALFCNRFMIGIKGKGE
jgi:hypothetical protein